MPPPPLPEGDKSTKGDRILTPQHHLPADIERTSFHIITEELEMMGMTPPPEHEAVVKRVIHTTADFDYARNLHFTPRAVEQAVKAPRRGRHRDRYKHGVGWHHQARSGEAGRVGLLLHG